MKKPKEELHLINDKEDKKKSNVQKLKKSYVMKRIKRKKEKMHKNGWSIMQMNAINKASAKNYNKFLQPIVALEMKKNMWEEKRNRGRIYKKNNNKQKYEKLYMTKEKIARK